MAVSPEETNSPTRRMAPLGILGLGVVNLALGFLPQFAISGSDTNFFESGGSAVSIALLFAAGVLAGVGALPHQRSVPTVTFALSLTGAATLLFQTLAAGSNAVVGSGTFAVLVLGFVQTAIALVPVLSTSQQHEQTAQVQDEPKVDQPAAVPEFEEAENTSYGLPGYGTPGNGGQGSVGAGDYYNSGYRDLTGGAPAQIGSAKEDFGSPLTRVGQNRSPATTGYDSPYGRTTDAPSRQAGVVPDSKWAAD